MLLIKDHINIIEKYTTYKNLYNFLIGRENLIYKCDLCKSKMINITKKNKILYKICDYNNNLTTNFFDTLNLEELIIINTINYFNITYKKCNLIFCSLCMYHNNKKSFNFNINKYENNILLDYISFDFYNYIIMNNKYFIKDNIINNKNINIKRIIFKEKNKKLELKYIVISNLIDLNLKKLKLKNYQILNKIIKYDFNFDIEYLKNYLKLKYD